MKHKVLITAPYFQLVVDDYRNFFKKNSIEIVVPAVNERMSEKELINIIGDVDGLICGDDRITDRVLKNAPRLKVIAKWGTGIDSIDIKAAQKRNIPIKNTPNAFTEPVADTILSFMLCFARGTIDLDRKVKEDIWEKKLNTTLGECTLGVVGIGNIGKAVIKRAQAFNMKVLGNDIKKDIPFDNMVALNTLLKESDFVCLTTDLNSTSYHLINEKKLSLMKPTAYIINASRGPVIEEKALIRALKSKKIAGAGLDVFENEPLSVGHPFKKMPNVILSPHNANSSPRAWKKVHENTLKGLVDVLINHHGKK